MKSVSATTTARRRALVPVHFALIRLRAHAERSVVVAIGIAIAAGVLALTAVGAVAVQDRAVQRALAQQQPSDRAIQAFWSGVPLQSALTYPQLNSRARAALEPVLHQPAFGVEVFRQATWGGAFVNLGAVDNLSRWLVLRSGHLPRPCQPDDCDVVQIGGAPVAPTLSFLHVVGRATFTAGAPLNQYFVAPGVNRPPILVADGVSAFTHTPLPDAGLIARTYGWIVPLEPGSIHDWDLAALNSRLDHAQAQLEVTSDFGVTGPTDAIAAVRATSRVAGERLLILGGDAAVLLLGFAVLASTRLRRDHRAVRRRLTWFGARRSQMVLVAATEVAAITIVASIVGWIAGAGGGALFARHLGAPGGLIVEHSIFTARAFGIAVALAVLTALVMLAAVRMEAVAFGGMKLNIADVAALGALGAVLLALARGKADATSLAGGGGTGVVLLLLPGLVLFILAVAAARLLAPLLRLLELAGRRAPPSLRIALLSLARSPGRVLLSVVFFVLSIGVALFAVAYRATLERGETEQARYAVPAPYVLQESLDKLVPVQEALPPGLPGATQVLRDTGFVTADRGRDFTLLALPANALGTIDGWRKDFSAQSPAALGRLLQPPVKPALRGPRLVRSTTRLTLPITITGDAIGITLVVLNTRGDYTILDFGEHGRGRHTPTIPVPRAARAGRIVALRLRFPQIASFVAGHRESGTTLAVNDASTGTLRLDHRFAGWTGVGGARVSGTTVHYVVNRAADTVLRPREPLEGTPVPIVASPAIARAAGPGGLIPLHVEEQTIQAHVVGVAHYFPSVDGDFVAADLPTWLAAANTASPGTTTASEVWLDAPTPPNVPTLDVVSQRATETQLHGDPLARGSLALLTVAAAVGLVLAVIGVLLTVVGDLRDESGELFDLSAQGATPSDLRRHVVLRALAVAGVGMAGGLAAGAIVSALVVSVVTVTAGAGTPLPPLELLFDWKLVALALAAVASGATLAAFAGSRRVGR
ncbi:MAG TPA: FtsX-like permease family protein [Gaiellaceae bacterium]|nr:FtsX-like permease family protein [Gaiellaceae bacterium]